MDDELSGREPCAPGIDRRALMAGAAAIGLGAGETAEAAAEAQPLQAGDRFLIAKGALKNTLARPELLKLGAAGVEAFPADPATGSPRRKNRLNRVVLLRLDPAEMDEDTRGRSAGGVLVYSAVCTHRGCTIQSWMPEERRLRCHCHLSEFDALTAGAVRGGPARRQLPMAPVTLDAEGFLVATDGFTARPGGADT